jgi:hypothetical protein
VEREAAGPATTAATATAPPNTSTVDASAALYSALMGEVLSVVGSHIKRKKLFQSLSGKLARYPAALLTCKQVEALLGRSFLI